MEQQLNDILEQQLRAPQTPEAISWWPLAPGWWIIAALLLTLACYAVIKLRQNRQKNNYRRTATTMLDAYYSDWQQQPNDGNYLLAANSVIKRACSHFDTASRKLSGNDWVNYLNALCKNDLSKATQTALRNGLYQKQPKADIESIHRDLKAWLLAHNTHAINDSEEALKAEVSNA
jgi:type II secretory pathway pseudopilin PulG